MGNKANKSKKPSPEVEHLSDMLTQVSKRLDAETKLNIELRQKLAELEKQQPGVKPVSILSKDEIKHFVESLLTNDNVNIKYLPDSVERNLYVNVFTILMEILKETLTGVKIDMMGHKLKLYITS